MSWFDVMDDDMANHPLVDAEIDALIEGTPVDGAPAQLTELVTALRAHAESSPNVPMSAALREFVISGTATLETDVVADIIPIRRGRLSLGKVASVIGLAPVPLLIGATMAAAAAVGGAHMAGVVDVPLLPDRAPAVAVTAPPSTAPTAPTVSIVEPPPGTTAQVVANDTDADHSTDTGRRTPTQERAAAPATTRNSATAPGLQAEVPPTLPDEAMVEGAPDCALGQETAQTPPGHSLQPEIITPATTPASISTSGLDPCDQAFTPTDPGAASADRGAPGAIVSIPADVGRNIEPSPPTPTPTTPSAAPASPPGDSVPDVSSAPPYPSGDQRR